MGDWADQVKSLVTEKFLPAGLVVDLTEVTYVDPVGERLLIWLCALHAQFVAETCYARDVCERLHLTLQEDPDRSSRPASQAGRSSSAPRPGRTRAIG